MILLVPAVVVGETVTTTEAVRRVTRTVASPTPIDSPLGTLALLSDRASWKVEVDEAGVVLLDARSDDATPFFLRYHPWNEAGAQSPIPGSVHTPTLSGAVARVWRVDVDPAVGVDVEIVIRFSGRLVDEDGRAWPFTLTDVAAPCSAGSCLP